MSPRTISALILAAGCFALVGGCSPIQQADSKPATVSDVSDALTELTPEDTDALVSAPANPFNESAANELPVRVDAVMQEPQDPSAGIVVSNCLVEGIDDNRISAGVDGILTSLTVEEGMLVKADEVIAKIDPQQAELTLTLKAAEMEQARLQAENDVNIRAAEKSMEYEWAEAKSAEKLHEKQAMTYWDMRREVLEAERSKLAIELARNEQKVAQATYAAKQAEYELAKHEIVKRQIKPTFDGIVATRYGNEGEWVQAGMPIVRVVRLDTVKIEGDVNPLSTPDGIYIGAPVVVRVHVANGRFEEFQSVLEYVSPILESDSTYRVWAKITNRIKNGRYLVSPGMPAEMTITAATKATLN